MLPKLNFGLLSLLLPKMWALHLIGHSKMSNRASILQILKVNIMVDDIPPVLGKSQGMEAKGLSVGQKLT
jgi:hypothetical protein